jgi:hypothetical protein
VQPRTQVTARRGVAGIGAVAAVVVGLILIYKIYSIGFSFGLSFDDEPNLKGLGQVVDFESAMLFVFGGSAGPLGRPLSMASFLIDIAYWPDDPASFIRTNTLIHLINILLVLWLGLLVARAAILDERRRLVFAVTAALLWGASPLILSSTLMIVQRMNLLASVFVLTGLIGFLKGAELISAVRWRGLTLAAASLGFGTLLGVFAKENAILLPVYAFCIVMFLPVQAGRPLGGRFPLWWKICFLYFPLAFVVAYLLRYSWLSEGIFPGRNFDLPQRLITESRILFRYLRMLLLPVRSGIGPYQDGFDVSESVIDPPTGLLSLLTWAGMVIAGLWTRRRHCSWLHFAVFWFLLGHLLESTVLGLELYFEHRNYLPSVGVWLAIAGWIASGSAAPALRFAALTVIALTQLTVLVQSARVWSNRDTAAAVWHRDNPASQRALMFRSSVLASNGDIDGMLAVVRDADARLVAQPDFMAYKLDVYCSLMSEAEIRSTLHRLRDELETRSASHHLGLLLTSIAKRIADGRCHAVAQDDVRQLFEMVSEPSPRFSPELRAFAYQYLRDYWIDQRNLEQAMYHARKRFELAPDVPGAELMVELLLSAQLPHEARNLLSWIATYAPRRPWVYSWWVKNIERLEMRIELLEGVHEAESSVLPDGDVQ